MLKPPDPDSFNCDLMVSGCEGEVLIDKSVTKELLELDSIKQARLLSNAKLWADGRKPTREQANFSEGRCGGKFNRMLLAIKTHKVRLYGFIARINNKKTMVIVDIDPAKKQTKADKTVLKRAKNRVKEFDERYGGTYG